MLEIEVENSYYKGTKYHHMLWALMYLKSYDSELKISSLAGAVNEKTFQKWSKIFINLISYVVDRVVSRLLLNSINFKSS